MLTIGWLVVLRQYFSLYRAVSQREGERSRNDRRDKNCPNNPRPHLLQALALEVYPVPSHHPTTPTNVSKKKTISAQLNTSTNTVVHMDGPSKESNLIWQYCCPARSKIRFCRMHCLHCFHKMYSNLYKTVTDIPKCLMEVSIAQIGQVHI